MDNFKETEFSAIDSSFVTTSIKSKTSLAPSEYELNSSIHSKESISVLPTFSKTSDKFQSDELRTSDFSETSDTLISKRTFELESIASSQSFDGKGYLTENRVVRCDAIFKLLNLKQKRSEYAKYYEQALQLQEELYQTQDVPRPITAMAFINGLNSAEERKRLYDMITDVEIFSSYSKIEISKLYSPWRSVMDKKKKPVTGTKGPLTVRPVDVVPISLGEYIVKRSGSLNDVSKIKYVITPKTTEKTSPTNSES